MPSFSDLMGMVMRTLQSPREGAHEVLAIGVPREAIWIVIAIVVVLSAFLGQVVALLTGGEAAMGGLLGSPVLSGVLQLLAILLTIGGVFGIVRAAIARNRRQAEPDFGGGSRNARKSIL